MYQNYPEAKMLQSGLLLGAHQAVDIKIDCFVATAGSAMLSAAVEG